MDTDWAHKGLIGPGQGPCLGASPSDLGLSSWILGKRILGKYPKHDVELDLELGLALELDLELRLALEQKAKILLRLFKLCHQKYQFRLGLGGVTSTLTR